MRTGALLLGIIGGLGGFLGGVFVLLVGGIGEAFGAGETETLIGQGWAAILLAIIGIIGGSLARARPTAAGILMLISGIGGFIAISAGYILGGPLLIVGGIMALVARKPKVRRVRESDTGLWRSLVRLFFVPKVKKREDKANDIRQGQSISLERHGGRGAMAQKARFCERCDKDIPADATFCPYCGSSKHVTENKAT